MEETLFTSGKGITVCIEVFILFLQPYPFLENFTIQMTDSYDGFSFDYKFNYILVFLGFSKLFIILRVILTNTIYMSPRCKYLFMKQVDYVECMDVKLTISILSNVYSKIARWDLLESFSFVVYLFFHCLFGLLREMYRKNSSCIILIHKERVKKQEQMISRISLMQCG